MARPFTKVRLEVLECMPFYPACQPGELETRLTGGAFQQAEAGITVLTGGARHLLAGGDFLRRRHRATTAIDVRR